MHEASPHHQYFRYWNIWKLGSFHKANNKALLAGGIKSDYFWSKSSAEFEFHSIKFSKQRENAEIDLKICLSEDPPSGSPVVKGLTIARADTSIIFFFKVGYELEKRCSFVSWNKDVGIVDTSVHKKCRTLEKISSAMKNNLCLLGFSNLFGHCNNLRDECMSEALFLPYFHNFVYIYLIRCFSPVLIIKDC